MEPYKTYTEMNGEELKETLVKIGKAIRKHSDLAKWGNVESKARLRELRASKKEVMELLNVSK